MKMCRAELSFCAAALLGLFYFMTEPDEFMALLIPAAVHELGHICALWAAGLHIKGIRADMKGFCISYYGCAAPALHALAAAAGPAAGILYALTAGRLCCGTEGSFLCLSAGFSLLLSLFNLLPAVPLDGGRIFALAACAVMGERRGALLSGKLSFAVSLLVFIAGVYFLIKKQGAALLIASIWLLFYQDNGLGIVKSREIL